MKLFYRKYGEGEPLLILHGLYGSSDNWFSIAKLLEKFFTVYLIDLRNHGQSEHSEVHSYDLMSDDVLDFIKEHKLEKIYLIGHSMGGKVAINIASKDSSIIRKLIIVDISPFTYENDSASIEIVNSHIKILKALTDLKIDKFISREEVDAELSKYLKDSRLRQFLLKNLKRDSNNLFYWTFNIESIKNNIYDILLNNFLSVNIEIEIPTLFIKGANSDYIPNEHFDKIKALFKQSRIEIIDNAGHWVHAENPKDFNESVIKFLLS